MRIAIASEVFLPKIDGITNRLRNTIECLREAGHEALVFAPAPAVAEHAGARVVGVPALDFPPYPGVRAGLPDPRIAWELARFRPDVVHVVGPACLGIWVTAAARALGLPVVSSYHTDLPGYLPGYGMRWAEPLIWPALRAVHNRAVRNLCPSQHTRRELRSHGVRNVGIWRGGVDTERFHPRHRSLEMRARMSDGRIDAPLLLYAGRLAPEKNVDLLAWVLDALPGTRLALVGDGPARADLERVFADLPVSFLGFLRGGELSAAFASADVFVMPSCTETLGFVVLEAMSSGLAVAAANAGGIPDMVRDGENGLLFDPESRTEAITAVGALLGSTGRRRFLAQQGRKTAENATWSNETRKLLREYERAIAHSRRGVLGRMRHALPV